MAEKYTVPNATKGDLAHTAARAAIASLPLVGNAAVELFQSVIQPPLVKRHQEWMNEVAEGLRRLENEKLIRIEELPEDQVFIDTVLQATQAALRTGQIEKRKALRNAVMNAACKSAPDDSMQRMFISWVDDLTEWHLRLLRLLADPPAWFRSHDRPEPQYAMSSTISGLITDAYPELRPMRDFYDQVGKDLYDRGLTKTDSFHVNMSARGAMQPRASEMGRAFLEFIKSPFSSGRSSHQT
jgi:hypothetical protein